MRVNYFCYEKGIIYSTNILPVITEGCKIWKNPAVILCKLLIIKFSKRWIWWMVKSEVYDYDFLLYDHQNNNFYVIGGKTILLVQMLCSMRSWFSLARSYPVWSNSCLPIAHERIVGLKQGNKVSCLINI